MRHKYERNHVVQPRAGGWIVWCLGAGGLLALSYCAITQVAAQAAMRSAIAAEQQTGKPVSAAASSGAATPTGILGTISIPQLHLSAPITSGIGAIQLIQGVGHIPGTAFPGGLGTMGLAGHRDTFFRALRRVQPGMSIRATGPAGTFHYQVDSTEIVQPEQVSILDIDSQPELVLITCYPFDYIGAAPRRFIVHAHLLSVSSDEDR